jgi:hypothetical protein
MNKARAVVDTLYYIINKIGRADKLKLAKLVYLADKYHVLLYGRTVTEDIYRFSEYYGIIGAEAEAIFENNKIVILGHPDNGFGNLSESDRQALDFIIEKFGNMDCGRLKEYTERFPESVERGVIPDTELLTVLDDGIFQVPRKHIELSRKFMLGEFD